MIRKAGPQDAAALESFLLRHAASSMFLRGNLEKHGATEMVHRHGTTFFIKDSGGAVEAVAGITNGGFLMCQAPDQPAAFWAEVVSRMQGRTVAGVTGVPAQTTAWIDALKIESDSFKINEIEPLFEVMLEDVLPAECGLELRVPSRQDLPMLAQWFAGYQQETGLAPDGGADAPALARDFVSKSDGRILWLQDQAVAMTSINARAVDAVQVGGVYVPPLHRGHGFGGAVVAMHLAELARQGIRRAVLFAASDFAARAYEAIGFRRVGGYRVAVLHTPMVVGAEPVEQGLRAR